MYVARARAYGHQKVIFKFPNMKLLGYEALSELEEIESHRRHYEEKMPKVTKRFHAKYGKDHMLVRKEAYDWSTFEKYLETQLCNCGNFGHSGKVEPDSYKIGGTMRARLVTRTGTACYSFLKTYNAHPIVSLPPWR